MSLVSWVTDYGPALLVLIGVVGEFVAQSPELLKTELQRSKLAKRATLLLILGLVLELLSIRHTQLEIAELNEQAEHERLSRMQLEAQISPRRLTTEQRKDITQALAKFSGRTVTVRSYGLDLEATILGKQLLATFNAARLLTRDGTASQLSVGEITPGIRVVGDDQELVDALLLVLSSKGNLVVSPEPLPGAPGEATPGAIVFVGIKPIPS